MSLKDLNESQSSAASSRVKSPWYGRVDGSLTKAFDRRGRVFAKGEVLTFEGDEAHARYCVVSGWLAATKSLPEGERQIVEFILPGETCDPTSADGETSSVELQALCDARVFVLDSTLWARLLTELPDLRRSERLRDTAARARQAEHMLRLGQSSAETRIAYVLIEFCMRMTALGAVAEDGSIHIPLGQKELADFTGLSSVHVCRTLRRLNRRGLITTGDHMDIDIHDVTALAELAGVDLDRLRREIIPGAT